MLNVTLDAKKIVTLRQISEFSRVFSSQFSKISQKKKIVKKKSLKLKRNVKTSRTVPPKRTTFLSQNIIRKKYAKISNNCKFMLLVCHVPCFHNAVQFNVVIFKINGCFNGSYCISCCSYSDIFNVS